MTPPDYFTPYNWQTALADMFVEFRRMCCIAKPGSGKTHAALLCGQRVRAQTLVVIAPNGRVCQQWLAVGEEWGCQAVLIGGPGRGAADIGIDMRVALSAPSTPALPEQPALVVIPWSRLKRKEDAPYVVGAFATLKPDYLIIDESHHAQSAGDTALRKNAAGKRKRTRNVCGATLVGDTVYKWAKHGLRHYAKHVLALTGTPATSEAAKVRVQLLLAGVDREFPELLDRKAYERTYWNGREEMNWQAGRKVWTTDPEPTEAHHALTALGLFEVDPTELARQLPAHRREIVDGFGGLKDADRIPQELVDWADACEDGTLDANDEPCPSMEFIADIRREATELRAPAIVDFVASWHSEEAPDRCLIIWCQYQDSVELLAGLIEKKLRKARVIGHHGGLNAARQRATLAAIEAGGLRVLVATSLSLGTGVDGLQHLADQALVVEAPRTPAQAEQLEGRIYRTGQQYAVLTRWLADDVEGQILRGIGVKATSLAAGIAGATQLSLQKSIDTDSPSHTMAHLQSPVQHILEGAHPMRQASVTVKIQAPSDAGILKLTAKMLESVEGATLEGMHAHATISEAPIVHQPVINEVAEAAAEATEAAPAEAAEAEEKAEEAKPKKRRTRKKAATKAKEAEPVEEAPAGAVDATPAPEVGDVTPEMVRGVVNEFVAKKATAGQAALDTVKGLLSKFEAKNARDIIDRGEDAMKAFYAESVAALEGLE